MTDLHENPVIGVLGGSGVYDMDGLVDAEWRDVGSSFGTPSDAILFGTLDGTRMAFLPRHGRGHKYSPSSINYRANIDAMKRAGVTDLISVSAVGSLREDLPPGHFVLVDQFIDRTFAREKSFFGTGCVAHVSMARPVAPRLVDHLAAACADLGLPHQRGGTYMTMEGPQFSTRAESHMYRAWGADIIGMTAMPEAKLAREAELPYALIGMATDYDCWREGEEAVEVSGVLDQMKTNSALARKAVVNFIEGLPKTRKASPIDTCLDNAIITAPEERDPALLTKLDAVAGRALKSK